MGWQKRTRPAPRRNPHYRPQCDLRHYMASQLLAKIRGPDAGGHTACFLCMVRPAELYKPVRSRNYEIKEDFIPQHASRRDLPRHPESGRDLERSDCVLFQGNPPATAVCHPAGPGQRHSQARRPAGGEVTPFLFHTPPIDSCDEEIYVRTVSAGFDTFSLVKHQSMQSQLSAHSKLTARATCRSGLPHSRPSARSCRIHSRT
jgi:hypothetical protein